jgi:hypothetical protein
MILRFNKRPGILYILLIELEGKSLVKIGVTHRAIEERVVEILTSIFKKYREFPYCRPKRFRTTTDIYSKEKLLHTMFESKKYKTAKKFSGHTEFFDMPLEDAVAAYEKLLLVKDKPKVKK